MPVSIFARWGGAVICVVVALMTTRILFAPIGLVMPDIAYYLPTNAVGAFGHIIFAPIALALMPFQFWTGLRTKRPKLHRFLGYGYVISVVLAALASLWLLPDFRGTRFAATGFFFLAIFWIACTGLAVQAARRRDFTAHQRWMLRSAALTFGAVTLRLQLPILFLAGYSLPGGYDLLAWDAWVPNLIVIEIWLKAKRRALRHAL